MKLLCVAGTHNGVGKTPVATGNIAALGRHGLRVEAFKAGPDYIHPSYLGPAAGLEMRRVREEALDGWAEVVARHLDLAAVDRLLGPKT